jgi:hypothetical protein
VIDIKHTPTPESRCPKCGDLLTAAASIEGATPEPDDISLCARCGQVLVFKNDLTQRAATPEEIVELESLLPFRAHRRLNQQMRRRRGAPKN